MGHIIYGVVLFLLSTNVPSPIVADVSDLDSVAAEELSGMQSPHSDTLDYELLIEKFNKCNDRIDNLEKSLKEVKTVVTESSKQKSDIVANLTNKVTETLNNRLQEMEKRWSTVEQLKTEYKKLSDENASLKREIESLKAMSIIERIEILSKEMKELNQSLKMTSVSERLDPWRLETPEERVLTPVGNVASALRGATANVTQGIGISPEIALYGDGTDSHKTIIGLPPKYKIPGKSWAPWLHYTGLGVYTVTLDKVYLLNLIRIRLQEEGREYMYYVNISIDNENWKMIHDRRNTWSAGLQEIRFQQQRVRYIRICPTFSNGKWDYDIFGLEARFEPEGKQSPDDSFNQQFQDLTTRVQFLEERTKYPDGNVALLSRGATATITDGVRPESVIDGGNFGWFSRVFLGANLTVKLRQVYDLNFVRLRINHRDNRKFKYYVQVSKDNSKWTEIQDQRNEFTSGWQNIYCEKQPVQYIRICPTASNNPNHTFDILSVEAFSMDEKWRPYKQGAWP